MVGAFVSCNGLLASSALRRSTRTTAKCFHISRRIANRVGIESTFAISRTLKQTGCLEHAHSRAVEVSAVLALRSIDRASSRECKPHYAPRVVIVSHLAG